MYIEFKTTEGTQVTVPYGSFFTVVKDNKFSIARLGIENNWRWEVTEEEFKKVEEFLRLISDLEFSNLHSINVSTRSES